MWFTLSDLFVVLVQIRISAHLHSSDDVRELRQTLQKLTRIFPTVNDMRAAMNEFCHWLFGNLCGSLAFRYVTMQIEVGSYFDYPELASKSVCLSDCVSDCLSVRLSLSHAVGYCGRGN